MAQEYCDRCGGAGRCLACRGLGSKISPRIDGGVTVYKRATCDECLGTGKCRACREIAEPSAIHSHSGSDGQTVDASPNALAQLIGSEGNSFHHAPHNGQLPTSRLPVEVAAMAERLRKGGAALTVEEIGAALTCAGLVAVNLSDLETAMMFNALKAHGANRTHAARSLGISVRTLQRKLKSLDRPMPGD